MYNYLYEQKGDILKKIIIGLLAACACLLAIMQKQEANTIIVYSSMEQFRNDELQKQLNQKFPDLHVFVMYMPTAKAAARIHVEQENTDADIVVNLETAYLEMIKDQLAQSSQFSKLDYLADAKSPDDRYVIWDRQAGSIIVNKDVIKKHHLDIPKTYDDLLKPEYKGLIAMPDPKSSGTGYFFYKNLVNKLGEKAALNYIDRLAVNVKQFSESGSGPVKLLIQGEVAIGLGLTFQGVNESNNGNHFEILRPEFGSPYSLTGAGIIKGREQNKDIQRVYSFIINDFLVYDKEYFSPEPILKQQVNRIPHYPKDIQYADMNGIEDLKEKERLLSLWKY